MEDLLYIIIKIIPIPINDILSMSKSDFARVYPDFECRDLYDKYIESLIMLEGDDAQNHIRSVLRCV